MLKLDDPLVGRLVADNLTASRVGISGYSDADWVGLDTQSRMALPSLA